jgi:hypothetical protein
MSDNPEIVPEKDCYGGVKLVCVPLFFGSKVLGVLCMFSLKENFLPEQISCMEPFLLQITLCMELKLAQRELRDAVQARDKALCTEQKIKTFYSCFSHELRNVINGNNIFKPLYLKQNTKLLISLLFSTFRTTGSYQFTLQYQHGSRAERVCRNHSELREDNPGYAQQHAGPLETSIWKDETCKCSLMSLCTFLYVLSHY